MALMNLDNQRQKEVCSICLPRLLRSNTVISPTYFTATLV